MENKRCIQIFLGLESIILGYMALIPSKLSEEYVLHFIPLCSGLALNLRTAITGCCFFITHIAIYLIFLQQEQVAFLHWTLELQKLFFKKKKNYHSHYICSFCNKSRWFSPGSAFLAGARTNFFNGLNCFPPGRELQYQQLSYCWLLLLCMFSSFSLSQNDQHPPKLLPLGLGPMLHQQQPLLHQLPVPAEKNSSDQLHGWSKSCRIKTA